MVVFNVFNMVLMFFGGFDSITFTSVGAWGNEVRRPKPWNPCGAQPLSLVSEEQKLLHIEIVLFCCVDEG